MNRRGWTLAVRAACALALVSLASNVPTTSELDGDADTWLAMRSTVSMLFNAGVVWGGLGILAGWLVRRPVQAFAAGIVVDLIALVVHYGTGQAVGMFVASDWASNAHWFLGAAILGGPLGLIGAAARRADGWGTVARLTAPVGAVLEPFVTGRFSTSPILLPWPERFADTVSGAVLLTAGVVGAVAVLVLAVRRRSDFHLRAGHLET